MISAFPKIFTLGQRWVGDIFDGPVEITEKVDGSQIGFYNDGETLHMRSKGAVLYAEKPEKMFEPAISYLTSLGCDIPDGIRFYGEYLKTPKHNVLSYNSVPKNHIALFAVQDASGSFLDYETIEMAADALGIGVVPRLSVEKIQSIDCLLSLLENESFLGGPKIEGFVVKNYAKSFLLGDQVIPIMAGKYVSEAFKEVHKASWGKDHTGKGKWDTFKESFCTEARWQKAVQRMAERGELTDSPKDIGALIKEVQHDIVEEEGQAIRDFLFREFGSEVLRTAIHGLPDWYKRRVSFSVFDNPEKF